MANTVKVLYKDKSTVIDQDTGEVISENTMEITKVVKSEEEFFFIFSKHLGAILGLNGNEIKVLVWASMHAELNTGIVVITKHQKNDIAEMSGLALGSVNNAMSSLKKKNIIHVVGRCTYKINPEYTWKGNANMRIKELKLQVRYQLMQE